MLNHQGSLRPRYVFPALRSKGRLGSLRPRYVFPAPRSKGRLWALLILHRKGEGAQLVAGARVELVLELHPGGGESW